MNTTEDLSVLRKKLAPKNTIAISGTLTGLSALVACYGVIVPDSRACLVMGIAALILFGLMWQGDIRYRYSPEFYADVEKAHNKIAAEYASWRAMASFRLAATVNAAETKANEMQREQTIADWEKRKAALANRFGVDPLLLLTEAEKMNPAMVNWDDETYSVRAMRIKRDATAHAS